MGKWHKFTKISYNEQGNNHLASWCLRIFTQCQQACFLCSKGSDSNHVCATVVFPQFTVTMAYCIVWSVYQCISIAYLFMHQSEAVCSIPALALMPDLDGTVGNIEQSLLRCYSLDYKFSQDKLDSLPLSFTGSILYFWSS